MAFKMFLLALSVLLISKVTMEKVDCETAPMEICGIPKIHSELPKDVSELNEICIDLKTKLKCMKDWQDECGTERMVLFPSDEVYEATYTAISDVCEEGSLLNSVVTENLKCFYETFSSTRCREESREFVEPFIEKVHKDGDDFIPEFSISCLEEALAGECVLRAASENCGKAAEEGTLELIHRSKSLEYMCTKRGAQSVLDELPRLKLSEEKKKSVTLLLEEIAGPITMKKMDCETSPFDSCGNLKFHRELPKDVSEFNEICVDTKTRMKCTKNWQDECGTERLTLYPSDEVYEATYEAISDVCEEGTLLNSVVTENLKCFYETFSGTRCREQSREFVEPFYEELRKDDDLEPEFSISCLEETLAGECVLSAVSENCGKLAEEGTLEFIRRSKSLEYMCTKRGAQTVLDELPNLKLSEEKKNSVTLLLENIVATSNE